MTSLPNPTWPALWSFDMMGFTFDSTDPLWKFDGGQFSCGGILTQNDKLAPITQFERLSVTRTQNY